jgi:tetratricopeptide (TPR) repeat protein
MVELDEQRRASGVRRPRRRGPLPLAILGLAPLLVAFGATSSPAADLAEAETAFRVGRYEDAARLAAEEVRNGSWIERWHLLKVRAEMASGLYPAALASLEDGLRRLPGSVALLLLGRDVYRYNGREAEADAVLEAIEARIRSAPSRYATPEGRVLLGRYYLARGLDARKVLDLCYDIAVKQKPDLVEANFAIAELALDKQDAALAATTLAKAPKPAIEEPHYHYLLARAFDDDDRARSEKELDEALKINPKHVDSLLLRASHRIDQERYAEAGEMLKQVFAINQQEPRAWAYQAVLAHLRSHPAGEASARKNALARWPENPEIDHIIGRELSSKYRFAEGSEYQKKALEFDPDYLPAKVQLCQDLLRLGREDEGWKLAAEIFEVDGYNVLAYNLTNLRDALAKFRTLKADGFLVRMDPREAELYGPRVLALLARARKTLGEKYGAEIAGPVTVEIFPRKKEFAVRTFGLPGAEGFLGVCFGSVITANSPASQGETPSNWEAVLWHEYCHVVTLNKTRNKMPRWLSEGISVYEEEKEDHAWGSQITPRYRAMLLGEDFKPLSQLSSAFLAPKSGMHLQFAYFESALAVEFLVEKAGMPALRGVLDDLGAGVTINESLPSRVGMTLEQLDQEFAAFARKKAEAVAPGMTWDEPDLPPTADSKAIEAWLEAHPKSFPGLKRLAASLVRESDWAKAKATIEKLRLADPDFLGEDNAYVLLAAVCRKTSDPAGERSALEALAAREASAGPAYLRLMELEEASGDWNGLARDARRMLAVNPLVTAPHRGLARAAEQLGQGADALAAYKALAILDETDPADTHFRLARMLAKLGQKAEARLEALKALEEAPRFLEAHKLLLELVGTDPPKDPTPPARRR